MLLHLARPRILAALPALFLCAASLHAAQTPYVAAVGPAGAEVRCKPSTDPKIYPTNRLAGGTRVLVLEERTDGWLGIQPPPGSLSWIDANQVERIVATQTNWVVKNDSVPVLIGILVNVRPSVEGVRLARGTQVHVLGQEVTDHDGSKWLPIDPPAGEIRYLRAETVKAEPTAPGSTPALPAARSIVANQPKGTPNFALVSNSTSSKDGGSLSIPTQPAASIPEPPTNATPWQRAEYYERQGRWEDACRIYEQLGRDLQATKPDWADFAIRRAAYLRNGGRAPVNWSNSRAVVDVHSSTFQPAVQQQPQARLLPPADPNAAPTQQTASLSSPPSNVQAGRSGTGKLVRSGYWKSGYAQYRLETADGTLLYATPGQGIDLEQYVDKSVELFGSKEYKGNLNGYYMVVTRVQPM